MQLAAEITYVEEGWGGWGGWDGGGGGLLQGRAQQHVGISMHGNDSVMKLS